MPVVLTVCSLSLTLPHSTPLCFPLSFPDMCSCIATHHQRPLLFLGELSICFASRHAEAVIVKVCVGHDPNRTRGPHAAEPMDGVLSVILGNNEHLGLLDCSALNSDSAAPTLR